MIVAHVQDETSVSPAIASRVYSNQIARLGVNVTPQRSSVLVLPVQVCPATVELHAIQVADDARTPTVHLGVPAQQIAQ